MFKKKYINIYEQFRINILFLGGFRVMLKPVGVSLYASALIMMHHDSAGAGLFQTRLTLDIFSHSGRRWSTVEL